uniref:Uncharacterized protein n=1 Tax=Phenylobacterium glaciei TaxID=2803784 RepID=A0A974P3I4_9CAUL|nr:hypothetical protein JKL49_25875 [Phenylobacterium glaciei]
MALTVGLAPVRPGTRRARPSSGPISASTRPGAAGARSPSSTPRPMATRPPTWP